MDGIKVVGAGPVGCYAALKLAEAGGNITVFEEHPSVGKPVQCTGIVTDSLNRLVDIKDGFVVNKVKDVRIYSPNGRHLSIEFKRHDLVLDRQMFDSYLAGKAQDKGVEIRTGSRFLGIEKDSIMVRDMKGNKTEKIRFSRLIGADGPMSHVAKAAGIYSKREIWHGAQARVKVKNDNCVEFYPHIGLFAWLVPEDGNTARVGVLARTGLKQHFHSFMKRFDCKVIEYQGGIVPVYNPRLKASVNNIYTVGDAACQVKATTGGGIVPGLRAADALARSIIDGKDYEKEWRKEVGKELWLALRLRKAFAKFSHKDYDRLVGMCTGKRVKSILQSFDRDNLSSIMLRLAFAEPRLMVFARKFI